MERQTRPARGQVAASLRIVRGADAAAYAASAAFLARRSGAPICLQLEEKTVYTPVGVTGSRLRRHYATARHLAAVFGAARRDVLTVARAVALLAARARVSVMEILRARPATGRSLVTLIYELARAAAAARAPTAVDQTVSIAADPNSILITEAPPSPDDASMEMAEAAPPAILTEAEPPVAVAAAPAISDAPAQDHPVVARLVSAVGSAINAVADRIGSFATKVARFFRRTPAEVTA